MRTRKKQIPHASSSSNGIGASSRVNWIYKMVGWHIQSNTLEAAIKHFIVQALRTLAWHRPTRLLPLCDGLDILVGSRLPVLHDGESWRGGASSATALRLRRRGIALWDGAYSTTASHLRGAALLTSNQEP